MGIKEKATQRRMQTITKIGRELQREVDRLDSFLEKLQEADASTSKFRFKVYGSGEYTLEVVSEGGEKSYFDLKNEANMAPSIFETFLKERLEKEGVEFIDAEPLSGATAQYAYRMEISLL